MNDNVAQKYTTPPTEASHYVQYDQGKCVYLFIKAAMTNC